MYRLIKKDFLTNKSILWGNIFWIMALLVLFKSVAAAAVALPMSFLFQTITVDEKFKVERLYFSLPVKRSSIVFSKYTEIFLFAVIGTVLTIIIAFMMEWFLPDTIFTLEQIFSLEDLYAIVFSVILLVSLFTPFLLAFGFMRGFSLGIGAILAFSSLLLAASYIVVLQKGQPMDISRQGIQRVGVFLNHIITQIKAIIGREMLFTSLFILMMILLSGSILISIKIYKKKEV